MTRARTTFRTVGLLGAAALVAAGCGGGGDAAVPTTETPAPSPDPNATTVVDPAAQVDPATGLPVDPAAAGGAAGGATTASVPELSGDDLGGGLGSSKTNPIFVPSAISTDDAKELFAPKPGGSGKDGSGVGGGGTDFGSGSDDGDEKPEAPSFSGAKIYVDGIVHDVDTNGTFPKGNPVFRLLSVTGSDIEIELVAGEFTSGGGVGTVLDKGELVTLVNSSEQLTYRVKFLRGITGSDQISF